VTDHEPDLCMLAFTRRRLSCSLSVSLASLFFAFIPFSIGAAMMMNQ
jgi:hypothetical protein